jgi:hypothetical protein
VKRRSEWWDEDAQPDLTTGAYATGFEHAPVSDEDLPEKRPIGFVDCGALRAIGCLKSQTKRKHKSRKRKTS